MFGVGHKRVSQAHAARIEAVARKHGFSFVQAVVPGTGYQHWFAGPNRGNPFNQEAEAWIWSELEALGLCDAREVRPPSGLCGLCGGTYQDHQPPKHDPSLAPVSRHAFRHKEAP